MSEMNDLIKDYVQQKSAAWREEDIRMSSAVMELITICPNLMASHSVSKSSVIAWLKSLKERYTWKPSDEQITALSDINLSGCISYAGQGQELINLYNDLKKL